MAKTKITVVRRTVQQDLIDAHVGDAAPDFGACDIFKDGQVFMLDDFPTIPEGFCDWAWADIQRDVIGVAMGADYPWINEPGLLISCCTDGLRPVIFKIERVE